MNQDQQKVVTEKLDNIQKTVNRLDDDLEHDRKDLQEFAIRLGSLENQIEEMRKSVIKLPQRTQEKVAEVTEPMMDEAQELKETIAEKKVIILQARTFWQKFKNWFGRGWE